LQTLFRDYSVFVVLAGIMIALGIATGRFLSPSNLLNVLEQSSILGIAAVGVTFTILAGGIDLSVGSVIALCGALTSGFIVRSGLPVFPAVLLGIASGVVIGAVNGTLVIRGRVQPFVTTLAMMAIARGLTLIYTAGRPISGMGDAFVFIGGGQIGPLPVPALIFVGIVILTHLVLNHTSFGIHV
jgi:ribose transport system permease protein